MLTKNKRKKMEDLIYEVFNALDKSGDNARRYKELLDPMTDRQFDTFFKSLFSDENSYLTLDVVDYERAVKMEDVEKAANVLGISLFEKVVMPHINMDKKNPVLSKFEVPVGYIHLKRMQQMLFKKNSLSTDIAMRSATTGQVVGADKNARETDGENFALVSLGVEDGMKEFMGRLAPLCSNA